MMLAKSLQSAAGNAAEANYIEDVFSTYLYTGNGSTQTITNGIDLAGEGGLVWIKNRGAAELHQWWTTVLGGQSYLRSNGSDALFNSGSTAITYNGNGFSLNTGSTANNASANTYVGWTFREQPKFFDVVTYTGNNTAGRTVAHNLGSVPGCIIVKCTSTGGAWTVYHRSPGATKYLILSNTDAETTFSGMWNNTEPTATEFTLGASGFVNAPGETYVAYLFAHDAGGFGLTGTDNVISCGSFTGNGSSGQQITLGYEPQFIIIKQTNASDTWRMYDNMRGMGVGGSSATLQPNDSNNESTDSYPYINATGFTTGAITSGTFIYIAIRRGPMKTPTTGTSVYNGITRSGTGAAATVTGAGFPPDLVIGKGRNSGATTSAAFTDKLRGVRRELYSTSTSAEVASGTSLGAVNAFTMDGFNLDADTGGGYYNWSAGTYINWCLRRAPGFFDEVCWTNNSNPQVNAHNLGVRPELAITKTRNDTYEWFVGANIGATTFDGLELNSNAAGDIGRSYTSSSAYKGFTATTFTTGGSPAVGAGGFNCVTYLFASCPGVSKCGSFTGNGSSQTINCGFTGGARFVMIKAASTTGDWLVADSARGIVSGNDPYLELNTTNAEVTGEDWLDTDSSGFVVNEVSGSNANTNGVTYIYLAIA